MGNRAVITMTERDDSPAIYLQWNGGKDSIEGFLLAAKKFAEVRPVAMEGRLACGPYLNEKKFMDEFAEMIRKHFGLNTYRKEYKQADTDNWDNGTYIINGLMEIVDRRYVPEGYTEEEDQEKTIGIALQIGESIDRQNKIDYAHAAGALRAAQRKAQVKSRRTL